MTHGTVTGYATAHCHCAACRQAWRDYARQWTRDARAGRKRLVPATRTRRYLRRLTASGHTTARIAALSGLSDHGIVRILSATTKRVTRTTEERILGVALDAAPGARQLVPSTDARRLLEAMRRAGFRACDITAMLGYRCSSSSIPTARNPRIIYRNYRRVRVLYELLARTGRVEAALLDEVMG